MNHHHHHVGTVALLAEITTGAGQTVIRAWRAVPSDAPGGRALVAWSRRDVETVSASVRAGLAVRLATAEELGDDVDAPVVGKFGERDVVGVYVVTPSP